MTHTKRTPLKPGVDLECNCEVTPDGLVFCPLHAAAPELLNMCHKAATTFRSFERTLKVLGHNVSSNAARIAAEATEAAIAKAEPAT